MTSVNQICMEGHQTRAIGEWRVFFFCTEMRDECFMSIVKSAKRCNLLIMRKNESRMCFVECIYGGTYLPLVSYQH